MFRHNIRTIQLSNYWHHLQTLFHSRRFSLSIFQNSVTWIKNIFTRKTLNTIIFEASPTTSVILFVCELCDFNFDSILKLWEHKENSHVSCLNSRRSQMTQRLIHCRLCDLKAKSSAALHEHTISWLITVTTLHQPTST